VLLTGVSLIACGFPAWRAAQIDPGKHLARRITLRYDPKGLIPKAGAVQPVEGS